MERHEILEMMVELKLLGMRGAFDEVLANGVKRQHAALKLPRFDGHPTRFCERCCHAENRSPVFTGVPSPDR